MTGKHLAGLDDQSRVPQRNGAKDHPAEPLGEPHLDRGKIADAAAKLGRDIRGCQNALHRRRIYRTPFKRAVQIDKMQPFEAGRLESLGLRGRIGIKNGCRRHFTAQQAHTVAILQINRRIQIHCRYKSASCFL